MTSLFDGLLALLLALILNALLISPLRRYFPPAEYAFMTRVFSWAIAVRYAGAVLVNIYAGGSRTFADLFWGDSNAYDAGGYALSQTWAGEAFASISSITQVSGFGFHYFVGLIYFLFGRNQLLVQFINGTISAFAGLVIYSIARDLYGVAAGRWALLFMSFFPQMVFWSCAMYKDPSILLCIALSMFAVLRLRAQFKLFHLLLFVAASLYLMSLRFYVFYMVAFAGIGTFLFAQRRGLFGSLLGQAALAAAFFAAIGLGVRRETLENQAGYFDLDKLQNARLDQSVQGRSAFASDVNVSTREGALAAIPVGFVYLMFAPFPWAVSGLRQLLTLPETLVWYGLMPALLRGLVFTVRTRLRAALPILVFAGTLTLAYAVFQSNVGTAYRQRTQITMFFFMFIGAGLEQKRQQALQPASRRVYRGAPRPGFSR
jgi:hypothetical protein